MPEMSMEFPNAVGGNTTGLKRDFSKAKLTTPRSDKGADDEEGTNSIMEDSQKITINKKGLSQL